MMISRVLLLGLCLFSPFVLAKVSIIVPKPSDELTPVNHYLYQIITEALAQMGKTVDIQFSAERMNQKRAALSLAKGEFINLTWLSKTAELQANLLPIEIPLYHGVHGLRLLIINKSMQDKFANVRSLADLKAFVALQKSSWNDYHILLANGLRVNGSLSYNAMFKALETGLGDYFPRSVMTIAAEIKSLGSEQLMLEPNLVLEYDNQYYFYLSKKTPELKALLEQGMLRLQASGRLDQIFDHYFANRLKGLNLESRIRLKLTLPDELPKLNK